MVVTSVAQAWRGRPVRTVLRNRNLRYRNLRERTEVPRTILSERRAPGDGHPPGSQYRRLVTSIDPGLLVSDRLVTPPLSTEDREVVERARGVVDELCERLRRELLARAGRVPAEMKDDGSPVTSLDVKVNEEVVAAVERAFPDHAVLSEELGTAHADSRWTWIVDPIDGTSNFTAGLPYWCISMALARDGLPVLGVVEAPPLQARYEAVLGEGATRDGKAIHVREATDFNDGRNRHVPLMLSTATARRARPAVRLNPRVMGSTALDLCQVADGTAAAAVTLSPKVWDIAAGVLLVSEAGGEHLTLDGAPLLPLRADTEYAGRSAPVAAGPNAEYLQALMATLVTEPIAVPRTR